MTSTQATDTYTVTITLEATRPDWHSLADPCWVARDESGTWRSYCKKHFADSAAAAVAMIFHTNEIETVTDNGETATAAIYAS